MAKTFSVAQLGHGAASRAIREAQQTPVLVSKENRPAAWILSAEKLAQVAAARGPETEDAYQQALALLAVELYREAILTLGQGAKLADMSLSDFIDLCGRLRVPILWESERGLEAEVEAAAAMADDSPSDS
jgi:predicted HTH domain antitoxin